MIFDFTLTYQIREESLDAILGQIEQPCSDAIIGLGCPGRIALCFTREAESAATAISSALADIESAAPEALLISLTYNL